MKINNAMAYLAVVLHSLVYGSSVLFTGHLLGDTGVFDVLAIRFAITLAFFLVLIAMHIVKIELRGKNFKPLLCVAIFQPGLYFIFETLGIGHTNAVTAGIIIALTPVFIVIAETIFLKERTTALQKTLLLLGIIGAVIIVSNTSSENGENSIYGIAFMLIAVIFAALYAVFSRKSSSVGFSIAEITFFPALIGAVEFNIINICIHLHNDTMPHYFASINSRGAVIGFLFLGIGFSVIATALNNYAVANIQTSSVAALGGLSTITAIILGVVIDGDSFQMYHIMGTVLILCGGIGVNFVGKTNNVNVSLKRR